MADHSTLVRLGQEIGLDADDVQDMLTSTRFTEEVRADEREAQEIGVGGVPFFVFDRKYTVSGAQQSDHFLGALEQAWKERNP